MNTYTVKQLEYADLDLTHGVYVEQDGSGTRTAVALCYNEPMAELIRDLLTEFEREVETVDVTKFTQDDARINELEMWRGNRPGG